MPSLRLEVSKTISFDAAHQLPGTPAGHKCAGLHGHTWRVRVWVTGELDQERGWVADFHDLESILRREAFDLLDHQILNDLIPNPTVENLALWILNAIGEPLGSLDLVVTRVEIQEGDGCWCSLTVLAA